MHIIMYFVKKLFTFIRIFSSQKIANWIFFKLLQNKFNSESKITARNFTSK